MRADDLVLKTGKSQDALEDLMSGAVQQNASDIHLTVGRPPTYRLHGLLTQSGNTPLTPTQTEAFARELTNENQWKKFLQTHDVEFSYAHKEGDRFRVSIFRQKGNVSLVLRRIPKHIMSMEEIGIPKGIQTLLDKNHGLILVTGPTGSGKSTTLASMIDYVNSSDKRHIITAEDPIEYLHEHKSSIINQREIGEDAPSFSRVLIEALRQDPDVILVGEMRDLETIETSLRATETGHLVLSTVHTFGAARTIDRIIDVFPSHQQNQIRVQLSMNLMAVISQQLIPRKDKPGRIAVFEIMVLTPAIQNLIRKGQTFQIQNEIQTGSKYGMMTLESQLVRLCQSGVISKEDARFYAIDSEAIAQRL